MLGTVERTVVEQWTNHTNFLPTGNLYSNGKKTNIKADKLVNYMVDYILIRVKDKELSKGEG